MYSTLCTSPEGNSFSNSEVGATVAAVAKDLFRSQGPALRCGMRVQIMLPANVLSKPAIGKAMWETLAARYEREKFVKVEPLTDASESNEFSFDPQAYNDTNTIGLRVLPHASGHVILMARLDNLGKGAAGVAIQNLNLMLSVAEETGLPA